MFLELVQFSQFPSKTLQFSFLISLHSCSFESASSTVLSNALKWEAQGRQADTFADNLPRMIHDDIIVAKMRPGQVCGCLFAVTSNYKNVAVEH